MVQLRVTAIFIGLCIALFYLLFEATKVCRRALSSTLNRAKDAYWSVKFCGTWIWWQRVLERDAEAVHDAHVRLGPVVRLGPNEISVNDVDGGLRPVYEGRLPKTEFYQVANSHGEEPMVAMRDEEPHRKRKKMVAKPYAKTYIMNNREWQAELAKLGGDLVSGLEACVKESPELELYDVFFAWSVAAISAYIFGRSGALNLLHDIPEARRVREEYFSQRAYQFIALILPIPSTLFHWLGYRPEIPWIWSMQHRADKAGTMEQAATDGWMSIFGCMKQSFGDTMEGKLNTMDTKLSPKESAIISSEMQDHMIAGIDTSTVGLAACAWLLSLDQNLEWQEKLRREIQSVPYNSTCSDLEQLPVLNAIIKETFRLFPPVAGGQPRITDKTVVVGPRHHEVTIPPGVKVHAQARSLNRSSAFHDPDTFRPERWLTDDSEKLKEMDRWFWAFGSGSRRCLGEHLGLSNFRMAVAAIWGSFDTRVTEKTKLTMSQGVVAMPLPHNGDYIRLRVQKVEA